MKKLLLLLVCIPFIFAGMCSHGGDTPVCNTPAKGFCPAWYLQQNPDVAAVPAFRDCPWNHYNTAGRKAGRKPCPGDVVVKPPVEFFKSMGNFRGDEDDKRIVYRWSKPGGAYPDGLTLVYYSANGKQIRRVIKDTSKENNNRMNSDGMFWRPKAHSDLPEWNGKLVVFLERSVAPYYKNFKKGNRKGAWLEWKK